MPTERLGRLPTIALALLVPVAALVTALVTLDVTGDTTRSASSPRAAGQTAVGTAVSIEDFRFSPDPIEVRAGTDVTVTNDDGTPHTLTANDRSFDTGDLEGGTRATIRIASPGTYEYYCDIHNYMTGTIEAT